MSNVGGSEGYTRLSILTHWITAVVVIALFLTHEGDLGSATYYFHVSIGAALGLFLLWRVWHRVKRGMTDKSDQARIFNIASQIVIWGFLAMIVVVVITGYLLPWSVGRPLDVLGLFAIPSPIESNRSLHEFVEELHELSGQLFVPLIALHILGAAKHAFISKDGIANRMFKSVSSGR